MHKAWQPKKQELKHFTTWETQQDNSFFFIRIWHGGNTKIKYLFNIDTYL